MTKFIKKEGSASVSASNCWDACNKCVYSSIGCNRNAKVNCSNRSSLNSRSCCSRKSDCSSRINCNSRSNLSSRSDRSRSDCSRSDRSSWGDRSSWYDCISRCSCSSVCGYCSSRSGSCNKASYESRIRSFRSCWSKRSIWIYPRNSNIGYSLLSSTKTRNETLANSSI